MIATVKIMVKRQNVKFSVKKQGEVDKSCTSLRSVKCNSGSDFAVILTMNVPPLDKTGKVDQMAESTGEMAMDQPVIPASTGKKCLSAYIVLYDALYAVVIKLSLLLFEMCKNKLYPCDLHKFMFNSNLFVTTYNCCLSVVCLNRFTIDSIVYVVCNSSPYLVYVTNIPVYRGGSPYNIIGTHTNGNIRSNWRDRYRE
jgi:hypothetical protein